MKNKTLLVLVAALLSIAIASCKKNDKTETPAPVDNTPAMLLSGQQTGEAFTGSITDFTLGYNGKDVVLLAAKNSTGKIYAVDLKDNNASAAAANAITAPVASFTQAVAARMGTTANAIRFINIEVNPVSKAVYALVLNTVNNSQVIFKITNGGNTVEPLDVSNADYCSITFSTTGQLVNDMTWGNNTLYVSFNSAATLDGEIAALAAPITHNTTATVRANTVYKSVFNGTTFYSDAPLESMAYGEVDGEKRLMGITVCAPGYSFKTDQIKAADKKVPFKEYFNLNTGMALKVFCSSKGGNTYLYELHEDGRIARIGKKYLNEGLAPANGRWLMKPGNGGRLEPEAGLAEEDFKVIAAAGTFVMAASYTDSKLLVINNTGQLSLLDI